MTATFRYLIKFSSEIMTKSRRSRLGLAKQVLKNLSETLKNNGIKQIQQKLEWGHIYLETNLPADDIIAKTPGIHGYSEVQTLTSTSPDNIRAFARDFFYPHIQGKTFAVRVKNRLPQEQKANISKTALERTIGADLITASSGVNLSNPQVTCYIEIRNNQTFFYTQKEQNRTLGGFPVGSSGKALVLYSGGIDSPVATFLALKTGILPRFIYFDLGSPEQLEKMVNTLSKLHQDYFSYKKTYLHYIDGTPILNALQKVPGKFQNLGLKYFFYKISEKVAFHNHLPALITGEALGQVSTQSFQNLATLDQITKIPVFRPLLFMQKLEIIKTAEEINTFQQSYTGIENCAVAQKKVIINASTESLEKAMENIDVNGIIELCLRSMKTYNIKKQEHLQLIGHQSKASESFDKIIFLDESGTEKSISHAEIIPFQQAWQDFFNWNKHLKYLLVCKTGAKSKLLATFMQENGFTAKGVHQKALQENKKARQDL